MITKNAIIKLISDTTCEDRAENLTELYTIAKTSLFDDLITSKSIKLKYDVMRVCMKINIIEINKTRDLKILKTLKIKRLLLSKIG